MEGFFWVISNDTIFLLFGFSELGFIVIKNSNKSLNHSNTNNNITIVNSFPAVVWGKISIAMVVK